MKKSLLLLLFIALITITYSQSNKNYYYQPVKTTNCKAHGVNGTIQIGAKVVKGDVGYEFDKEKCSESERKDQLKVPKIKKGYQFPPNGKTYYYDGKIVYEVNTKKGTCSAKTMNSKDFWLMVQNM